jgi:hypothetical protein
MDSPLHQLLRPRQSCKWAGRSYRPGRGRCHPSQGSIAMPEANSTPVAAANKPATPPGSQRCPIQTDTRALSSKYVPTLSGQASPPR